MKLSIIVPVYKVEKYIKQCIESILNQTCIERKLYEIIIINDGTPDKSMEIARECTRNVPNVVLLEQSNMGLSEARNNGLKIARGDYVWFIDSDDTISEESVNLIFKEIDNNPDIIQIQYQVVFENKEIDRKDIVEKEYLNFESKEYGTILKRYHKEIPIPAQFTIYNRMFLLKNNLFFKKGIYHEDCEFKPRVLFYSRSIVRIPNVLYYYLVRENGAITSSCSLKHAIDMYQVIDSLNAFSNDNMINLSTYICMFFNTIQRYYKFLNKNERSILKSMFLTRPYIVQNMLLSSKRKYRFEGNIFSWNPNIAFYLFSMKN